jgi:hypothetical protein
MADTRLQAVATADHGPERLTPGIADLRPPEPCRRPWLFTGSDVLRAPAVFAHPAQPMPPVSGRGGRAAPTGIPPVCRTPRAGRVRAGVDRASVRDPAVRSGRAGRIQAAIPRGDSMGADRERAAFAT